MDKNIYEFSQYKAFLQHLVGGKRQRRGIKAAIAKALRCQPTYVSQVVHGEAQFSLEQAEIVGRFLGLTNEELEFLLLLVQKDRAGTPELRNIFQMQMNEKLAKRMLVTERLGAKNSLTKEDQSRFYSSWHFGAFHIAVTIPALQSRDALADFFRLPMKKVNEVLEFLIHVDLIKEEKGILRTGITEMRLGNDSANIVKHHTNWRMRAIDSLDKEDIRELHYSGVVSISKDDALKIKDQILESIKKNIDIVKKSPEEELYCYTLDFFNLRADR